MRARPWRWSAALGGLSVLAGTVLFAAAVIGQGPWYAGYVSEAGVAGQDRAGWYRAGLLGVSSGLVLLALGLRWALPGRLGLAGAGLVAGSGACAAVSASVTCSPGCPLPPYEPATPSDLVHAAASVLGVGACVLAMAFFAYAAGTTPLGRFSRWALSAVLPLVAVAGIGLLILGRTELTGLAERLLLLAVTAWTAVAAMITARG